jgi:hypothetical protein
MSQISAVITDVPLVLVKRCMRILYDHSAFYVPSKLEHLAFYESSHIDCEASLSLIHKMIKQWLFYFVFCFLVIVSITYERKTVNTWNNWYLSRSYYYTIHF